VLATISPAVADVVPRDGTWGNYIASSGAMAKFVMRNQVISDVEYQIPITCLTDGVERPDAYKGGDAFPANTRLRRLTVERNYMEMDEGYSGREMGVVVTVNFRGPKATMTIWANRSTGNEPCDGRVTIPLKRGPLPSGTYCEYNPATKQFDCT